MEDVVMNKTFTSSSTYSDIVSRSFECSNKVADAIVGIVSNSARQPHFERHVSKAGLWNHKKGWFLSNMLLAHTYATMIRGSEEIDLAQDDALDRVLLNALSQVNMHDLVEGSKADRYENGIGCMLTARLASIPNLYVSPQTVVPRKTSSSSGQQPTIDFYLNGRLNKYLELVRNGVDIGKHLDKFENTDGAYHRHRDNYVILDFELRKMEPKGLPAEYAHLNNKYYCFVKQQNVLYKGKNIISIDVSNRLPKPGGENSR
jgi:hypothetical protein